MPWTTNAVLGIAASVLVVWAVVWATSGAAVAFADVAAALNKVQTATWKTVSVVNGPQNKPVQWTGIGMFMAPSHERTETMMEGGQAIQIVDGQQDKVLVLNPAAKTATVISIKNLPKENLFGKTFLGIQHLAAIAQEGGAAKSRTTWS